ncbi:hypothetical protein TNCV_4387581 [Trichonephila clavipes]|nr:hypothetical protein TNCV_4387581 [Trichonephila clavipes]
MYLIKRSPRQNGEGGRAPKHERYIEAERRRGEGKNAGRQSGRLKAVNQGSDQARQEPSIKDAVQGSEGNVLDTLRENCGIIRKQASTDGGVLWKVMCVDVVQVR